MMEVEIIGAAGTVTGSKHLVRTRRAKVLLDCGLFQGHRKESLEKNRVLGFDPASVDAVVLSHAHIDHSGALPILVKQGFGGAIHATHATRDLCAVMLLDAANIQSSDARFINRAIERDHIAMTPVEPLFDENDVARALGHFVSSSYHRRVEVAPGIRVTFLDAGHVLGSAVVVVDVEDGGEERRLVFTGDLGRESMPLLRPPEVATGAHVLITESTYGDRIHPPIAAMSTELQRIVQRVAKRSGKIVIPSFALERAQEVIYALKSLVLDIPIFVDSPLAVKITDIFKLHPECLATGDPASYFDSPRVRYVSSVEDSKAIDATPGPAIIIAGSGMCEGGRVLHHLRATVEDPRSAVVIVGFQAQHTLGRRIVERRRRIPIFGVERDLNAEVYALDGFSAHADRTGLVHYANAVRAAGPLERVVLVHGEPPAQHRLADDLEMRGFRDVRIPQPHTVIPL